MTHGFAQIPRKWPKFSLSAIYIAKIKPTFYFLGHDGGCDNEDDEIDKTKAPSSDVRPGGVCLGQASLCLL